MSFFNDLLRLQVQAVSVSDLGLAFLFILGGFTLSRVAVWALARMRGHIEGTEGFREAFFKAGEQPAAWAFIQLGLFLALKTLPLPQAPIDFRHFTDAALLAGTMVLVIWFGINLVEGLCDLWDKHVAETETPLDDQLVPIVRKSAKVFLVVAGAVMVVQNLGYSVTSLVAGLGLGGAALALASKDTVANLFGSIVIFLDQPFYVGDWIEIGDKEGVVEEVGLRVTRLRTFANSVITIPNAQLTTMTINNWSRMRKRRITMTLQVARDARPEQLVAAVTALRGVLAADSRICQDFSLVNFTAIGPSSFDIFVYCFTTTTDWAEHLQVRQDVLLAFIQALEMLGLCLAYPTQSLHVAAMERLVPAGAPAAMDRELPL